LNIFYLNRDPEAAAFDHIDKHVVKMISESAQLLATAHRVIDGEETIGIPLGSKAFHGYHSSNGGFWQYTDEQLSKRYKVLLLQNEEIAFEAREKAPKLTIMMQVAPKMTHVNHPSAKWVRESMHHYNWLFQLYEALHEEKLRRYDGRVHADYTRWHAFLRRPPYSIPTTPFVEPPQAMPDCYKVGGDSVEAYRRYYVGSKFRFAKWKHNSIPRLVRTVDPEGLGSG
jgi:coenzyme F420-reducing hydrogenase alpha subunit